MSTPISPRALELLQDMRDNFEQGLVPISVYNDPELSEVELDRVFNRNWVFLAHESEIPEPGDYVLRTIGEDPWIVVRDENGTIRVLLDSCRHRGAQVCRADKGNTSHFRCPYHGWTYKNSGDLAGVPHRVESYRELDLKQWGLIKAPHVDTHRGLVFACLASDAPALSEYLGGIAWYLDVHLALTEFEVLGDPHRWVVGANWKIGAENFAGDSYHTESVHRSVVEVGLFPSILLKHGAAAQGKRHISGLGGHAANLNHDVGAPEEAQFWGYPSEVTEQFDAEGMDPDQYELAKWSKLSTGTVFPNLSYLCSAFVDAPGRPPGTVLMLRQWQPRGPAAMELWSWILVPKGASEEYKERVARVATASFSPSGNFEEDDTAIWSTIARTAGSRYARSKNLKLNYQMGMPGMAEIEQDEDWRGPGVALMSDLEDGGQRTVQRRWIEEMLRP